MAPPSGATLSSRPATTSKVTPVPVPKPGPISNRPPAEKSAPAPAAAAAPTTTATFGVLSTSDSTVPDASSGPHRDGRIRNPVPSKLKGKTDGSKGNFSVMHMDVAGRTEATERDAEAKRTSESTELAARRAYENGYVSLRRSRFIHIPDEPEPVAKPFVPPQPPLSATVHRTRQTPLSPEETKAEQARLLTLLRSLHPVLVVDQICKALAFFGGIPGGPPPNDGFPQSAESNGSGSLFVGWIAEIFPRLGGNTTGQPIANPVVRQPDPPPPVSTRRKRGRPKGSKGTRPRIDKGIKKGPLLKAALGASSQQQANAADESWVDVDDDVDEVDANVMLLAQNTTPQPQPQPQPPQSGVVNERPLLAASTPVRTTVPAAPMTSASTTDLTASARRRGRPKGSKNRPKDGPEMSGTALNGNPSQASNLGAQTAQASSQLLQAPSRPPQASQASQASTTPQAPNNATLSQPFTPVNAGSATKKLARSKASGTTQQAPNHLTHTHVPLGQGTGATPGTGSGLATRVGPEAGLGLATAAGAGQGVVINAPTGTPTGTAPRAVMGTVNTATPAAPPSRSTDTPPQSVDTGLGSFAGTDFVYSVPPAGLSTTSTHRARSSASQSSRPSRNSQGQTLAVPTPPSASPALSNAAPGNSGQKRKRTVKTGADSSTAQSSQGNRINSSPQTNGPALPTPPANIGSGHTSTTSALQPPAAKRSRRGKGPKGTTTTASQAPTTLGVDDSSSSSATGLPSGSGSRSALSSSAAAALSLTTSTESSHAMTSLASEASVPPIHSPHQNHYEVQSPTMENYEAQLQAQFEQQAEIESQAMSQQTRVDSPQYMSARLQQQQQHQPGTASASASQRRSPNTQSQPSNPQGALSLTTQSQSRTTTQNQYPQYRPSNPQYNQIQHSKQNQSSSQSLSSSQQQQQQQQSSQFPGQQKSHGQTVQASPAPQYSTSTSQQQQQYPSNQSSYTNKQQQQPYSSGQQQQSSQQRYQQQQLATPAGSTTSYNNPQQSSQFGGSASNSYTTTADGTYRGSSTSLGGSTYVQRSQSATPSTAASFRSSSTQGLARHSPSFNPGSSTAQQRSGSTGHATNQSVQGMPGSMQAFSGGNTGSGWDLFDTGHMDASGQQSALGLTNTYGINATNVRTSNSNSTFNATGLGNFDGLSGTDRYNYGVGRR
ncbi:hypothetical protein QBC40DRAFT_100488 [Triangularia verruculosa]|uniref:Uncharacterized protein n=1 Tax=Triangularia verruculosa TaxID=2587418 RepID=A0AAN6XDV3_9PEZI|nr:hypothetical protein QBC40DRAFT_100488 [Triangularia verruculosa]